MTPTGPTPLRALIRAIGGSVAGAFLAAGTISVVGARFGREGTKVAVIALICGAVLARRRSLAFALAVLAVTPIASWVMLQGLAPIDGVK